MTKVLLVRHGETDWNREEIFRGRIDVELNDNGREQARALAEATRRFHIDAIYSSPLGQKLNYLWAGGKIVSRSSVQTYPTSDVWYGPNILLYGFITISPEEVAKTIRPYFT